MNLNKYIRNRIDNAKDLNRVFRNLEKEGYIVTTRETSFMKVPCFCTEIGGMLNGKVHTVNVTWVNNKMYEEAGCIPHTSYKQTIFEINY